jgi:hypothetical protein
MPQNNGSDAYENAMSAIVGDDTMRAITGRSPVKKTTKEATSEMSTTEKVVPDKSPASATPVKKVRQKDEFENFVDNLVGPDTAAKMYNDTPQDL